MRARAAFMVLACSLACSYAAACRPRPAAPPPEVVESGRFPHPAHADVPCTDCHDADAVLAGRAARPGVRDHAPCDRAQCHQAAFLASPGAFCRICHERVDATRAGASPLVPYPPARGQRALASAFSHARHMRFAELEAQVGFHVSCTDCHLLEQPGAEQPGAAGAREGGITMPGHAACGRCHAPEAAPPGVPVMPMCQACHQDRPRQPRRRRRFIVGDLRFAHGNHRSDRRGEIILCDTCHTRSAEATTVGDHPLPRTATCVQCHDDQDRTPAALRMRVCETCHATRSLTIGVLAPRSHLPDRERPQDHTLAFRRDHGTEARADAVRCARCHTFMSGSSRAVCDECHQVMRPSDHMITWRELDHGPAAATSADRCSTCHGVPFCIACHSRPPRSHYPLGEFRAGGHAVPASLGMRTCLTCHQPQVSCTGSGCHALSEALRR